MSLHRVEVEDYAIKRFGGDGGGCMAGHVGKKLGWDVVTLGGEVEEGLGDLIEIGVDGW